MEKKLAELQQRRAQGQGGFTLIELLVVIAILAVLAGVVVFAIGGITDNSDATACEIEARTVKTAVQAYRAQEREWPAAEANIVPGFLESAPENVAITYIDAATSPTYAWAGPSCPNLATAGDIDPLP